MFFPVRDIFLPSQEGLFQQKPPASSVQVAACSANGSRLSTRSRSGAGFCRGAGRAPIPLALCFVISKLQANVVCSFS